MSDDGSLEGRGLAPWIGERYASGGRFGVRVLVLGKSSYGSKQAGARMGTRETVRWFTQRARTREGGRHWYFTMVANVLRGRRDSIDDHELATVFQEICFYNFLPSVRESPVGGVSRRGNPTLRQWANAKAPFRSVLEARMPHAVLVVGQELSKHTPDWPNNVDHAVVPGGLSSRLRYDNAIPAFRDLVERARRRVGVLEGMAPSPPIDGRDDADGLSKEWEIRDEPSVPRLANQGSFYTRLPSARRLSATQFAALAELFAWAAEVDAPDLTEALETRVGAIDRATARDRNVPLGLPLWSRVEGPKTLAQWHFAATSAVYRAAAGDHTRAAQVDRHLAATNELVTNALKLWRSDEAAARYLERPSPQLNGNAPIDLAGRSLDGARQAASAVRAMCSKLEELDARAQEIASERTVPTPDTVLRSATDLFGDERSAQAFLEQPHPLLGGESPSMWRRNRSKVASGSHTFCVRHKRRPRSKCRRSAPTASGIRAGTSLCSQRSGRRW